MGVVLLVVIGIQFPAVQQRIINAATGYVSNKTHTRVEISRIAISFPKNIVLEGVFVEDLQHDTLLSVTELSVGADLWALLKGKVAVSDIRLSGATSRIRRTLPDSSFNFNFLIDAFASGDKTKTVDTTTSKPPEISIGQLNLNDIRFTYDDEISGMYTNNTIGELNLSIKSIDLEHFSFVVDELYLAHSTSFVELRPTGPTPAVAEDTSALPFFAANTIKVEDVDFTFKDPGSSLFFRSRVGALEIQPNSVDLNKQLIDIRSIALNHSSIQLEMIEEKTTRKTKEPENTSSDWSVVAQSLLLAQNDFSYNITNLPKLKKGIDYNHLKATNINVDAKSLSYSQAGIKGDIRQLSVHEQSGISVQKFRTRFMYDSVHAELANLYLKTERSTISNYLSVAYPSIDDIGKHPGNLDLNLHFAKTTVDMKDVLVFVPELANDPSFSKNAKQRVVINGRIKGKLSDLWLTNLNVQTGSQTAIAIDGRVKGLPDADKLWVDLAIPLFNTSRQDLAVLLPDSTIPSTIQLPQKMMVKGQVKGSLKNIRSNLTIQTSDGSAKLIAAYKLEDTVPVYDILFQPTLLDIGAIVKQPMIGKITGKLEAKGRSFIPKQMVTTLTSKWELIELNKYGYTNLVADASANLGVVQSLILIDDKNIELKAQLDASVKPSESYALLTMSLAGANLQQLNLTDKEFKTSGELKANLYDIVDGKLTGNIGIGDVLVVTPKQRLVLDSMLVVSINEKRRDIKTDVMLKVQYSGETQLQNMPGVIQQYISRYWGDPITERNLANEGFSCAIKLNSHPILTDLLVPELGQFYGMDVTADYAGKNNSISITADAPYIEYGTTQYNNLHLKVNNNGDSLMYYSSLQSITNANYFIDQLSLNGSIGHNQLRYDLRIIDPDTGYKLKVTGLVQQEGDSLVLRWLNEHIVLNNQRWDISKGNRIVVSPGGINIQQFNLTHQRQFLNVNSTGTHLNAPLRIGFGNFDLAILSQMIEKDSAIIQGILDGKAEVNPADKFAFTSDLTIKQIALREVPVGTIYVNANNQNGRYNANIKLSGNGNEASINGFYENQALSLDVNILRIKVQSIEAFIPQTIKRSEGYISGDIRITGKADHPVFNGDIGLKEASFNVAFINSRLSFKNEHIFLNNDGVRFKEFTVLDSMQQPLVIDGFIHTSNFVNMRYDLHITTRNFRVLNTTAKDNPLYYGTILLNSSIEVKGTEKLPRIDADVKLIDGSDLTFVVQQGELSVDKGDGVVVFIDTSANAIMKDTSTPMVSSFVGLDITCNIEVNRNTKFKIITDAVSGDNLIVSGDARLNFGIDESGKMSLVGAYILSDGSYKASLQKVVKREFGIKRGSTITWSGDPLDATIDITATYRVRTGATDLMAAELAGTQEGERNKYRKLLNYDVNLIIKGFLLKPELTFHLDMPPKDQLAFEGQVFDKITQINNNPSELNKQVFSLLILGKFIPMGTGSNMTASDAASSIARNSVNQLFSDQLNNLSGKYIKGAELNFNIQSNDAYSDAGATQQSTEVQIGLKKELFNNRMSVQVGSNIDVGASTSQSQAQTITGDMVMEYKITEDGTYRFKAFTENSYEGIIDGQLYKTGIGFLYSKDYDSISQLFTRPKKVEKLKTQDEKAD